MNQRHILITSLILVLLGACQRSGQPDNQALLELDAPELALALAEGQVSAEDVTRAVLARIALIDDQGPTLNAVIEVNPEAIAIARDLDSRFTAQGPTGPLHGLPVILKANIDTGDSMATSAGSLALASHYARDDAELVRLLRAAGAIVVAKANLSEWANFRGTRSTSGWSSLGGQTRNPYVLDRNPCGSSSGSAVAVAARLVPLAIGTETDGSIVCPASVNGVVGIKPTQGSVSQDGIIPLSHTQDIAGPLARTVRGAALLLSVIQGKDPGSVVPVNRDNLDGIRLGVWRDFHGAGEFQDVESLYSNWLTWLEQAGAVVIDPLVLDLPDTIDAAEFDVLLYEFKSDLDTYLRDAGAEPATLEALIEFNILNAEDVMPFFGQELFLMAQEKGELTDAAYQEALLQSGEALRAKLQEVFTLDELDAIIAPVSTPAWKTDWIMGDHYGLSSSSLAAVSGYPSVAVPGGMIANLPVSLAFIGRPGSENRLLEIAAVFEALRGPLPAPAFIPSIEPEL